MNRRTVALISGLAFASIGVSSVSADPIVVTAGTGSAVQRVDAQANFETQESLGHTFVEGGLTFTRVNLSDNNNSCGFAGCSAHDGFAGFTGNYLYGVGANGYLQIGAAPGQTFKGLEFVSGSGFGVGAHSTQFWETYLAGTLVGKGSFPFSERAIVGFSDLGVLGFDAFRFYSYTDNPSDAESAPAMDSVRAEYHDTGGAPVPEPASLILVGSGILLGFAVRRRGRPF
jgi:hypothetical protein